MSTIKLNLTVVQKRKLLNGHTVQLVNSQIGKGAEIMVDMKTFKRLMRAEKAGKGVRITASPEMMMSIEGAGFKSVMRNVGKTLKKGVKSAVRETKNVFNESVKPVLKEHALQMVAESRPKLDKAIQRQRVKTERAIEDTLINALGDDYKELVQDVVTGTSANLSKRANDQLDNLQVEVEDTIQGMGMVKNKHYTVHGGMIVLKGGSAKSFFRKLWKGAKNVITSKPVRSILNTLAKTGASALGTMATGNPLTGEMLGSLVTPAITGGLDDAMDAIKGSGRRRQKKKLLITGGTLTSDKTTLRKPVKGGALYVPTRSGGGLVSKQAGKYYI
jgi:hypothetical protein